MGGRPFCSGAQGGAFAVSRARARRRAGLARPLPRYAKLARRAGAAVDASWGGDQAPLAELMGARCGGAAGADGAWTFGNLPYALNVRDAFERGSDGSSTAPCPSSARLVLHQKRYLKTGTVAEPRRARGRLRRLQRAPRGRRPRLARPARRRPRRRAGLRLDDGAQRHGR
ncbi:hypothetical protein JL722_12723 [Aureococcus anophagefferens]|nr:hypothetical protein JL722_12723 [Aureococcus anophagefferens]